MALGYPWKEHQHLLLPLRMPQTTLVLSHISSLPPTVTAEEAAPAHLRRRKLRLRKGRSLAQGKSLDLNPNLSMTRTGYCPTHHRGLNGWHEAESDIKFSVHFKH